MTTIVYHVPLHLAAAYAGRKVIVRAPDSAQLVMTLSESARENLVGVQLLSLTADVDALADWAYGLPLELAMLYPAEEFPLLYRHAKLLDKHPIRVSIPVTSGFSKAVQVACSLQYSVKLELHQPTPAAIDELRGVLAFYLHQSSVAHINEEDPAHLRYITDDGRETIVRRLVSESVAGDLNSFVARLEVELLAEGGECAGCEFFKNCGGYFKWPHRDFSCDGVKLVFRALQDAAGELEHDLAGFLRTKNDAAP
jgi:hypothetical protein